MANTIGKGQWQPGQSGNPGGRPRVAGAVSELARAEADNCIKLLIQLRDDPKASKALRMAAADKLLDRGIGRPTEFRETTIKRDGLDELLEEIDGKTNGKVALRAVS